PFDIGHHVEDRTLDGAGIKKWKDMRVLQFRGGLDFSEKSLDANELRELAVHDLDGDLAIVTDVVRQVDVRHPATADLALDDVSVGESSLQAIEELHRTCQLPCTCRHHRAEPEDCQS